MLSDRESYDMSPELPRYTDLADTVPAVVYTAAIDDFGATLYINR